MQLLLCIDGVRKNDFQEMIVVHQIKEGVAKAMFEVSSEPIEAVCQIWDSTLISSYFGG